jgi:hypothetical protein
LPSSPRLGNKKSLTKKPLKKSGSFNPIPITYIRIDLTGRKNVQIFSGRAKKDGRARQNAIGTCIMHLPKALNKGANGHKTPKIHDESWWHVACMKFEEPNSNVQSVVAPWPGERFANRHKQHNQIFL